MKITMLSNFNNPVRGVSPYSDRLLESLQDKKLNVEPIDYKAAYPAFLAPNNQKSSLIENATVDYKNPFSWYRFAKLAEDLIHIQYWTVFSAYYLYFIVKKASSIGKKTVLTVHNPKPHEKIPFLTMFEQKLLSKCDLLIVHTQSGKDILQEKLAEHCPKIVVIHHGVNVKSQSKIEVNKHFEKIKAAPYILVFGNIRKYKGTDLMIDAWKSIYLKHPNYRLKIAGNLWGNSKNIFSRIIHTILRSNSYAQKINGKLKHSLKYNIDADLSFIEANKLDDLVKNASLAIFPYRQFSAQSGALSQAISFGTPVICSDLDGLTQGVIDDSFVVNSLTQDQLSKVIVDTIGNMSVSTRIAQLAVAKTLSWDLAAEQHLKAYSLLTHS